MVLINDILCKVMCTLSYLIHFISVIVLTYWYFRVKNGSLKALVSEPEKFVKNSIVQFIGTLVKHEFPNQRWPELLQFIEQLCSTESPADKEVRWECIQLWTDIVLCLNELTRFFHCRAFYIDNFFVCNCPRGLL